MHANTMRARGLLLAALTMMGPLALAGCRDEAAANAVDTPVSVTVGTENIAVVRLGRIESGPAISGSLAPEREAVLRAELGGQVMRTLVEAGQRVGAGQLLVQLDDASVRDQFLSARSAVTAAQQAADAARRELDRATTLADAGAIAERQVDVARTANVAAQSQLADARSRLTIAQEQMENARITAPFAGVVSARPVSAGDIVAPGTPLVTVVDPSSMRLEASVPAEQLGDVRLGAPVQFTVSGYPDRPFTGRVTRVNPTADPTTRQVRILVGIPNVGTTLVAGLFAEGRVASEAREAAVVPQTAVDRRGATPTVMRIKNGKVEQVRVTLGLMDTATETVEIRDGVAPGDTVLLGAAQGITPGTPVQVNEPEKP